VAVLPFAVAYRDLYVLQADEQSAMPCPRCGQTRQLLRVAQWQMSACAVCNGTFVGFSQLEELMQSHDRPGDIQAFALQNPIPMPGSLACAKCNRPMQRSYFFHQIVDVCKDHGAWFDVDELTGAMERMRQLLVIAAAMAREPVTVESRSDPSPVRSIAEPAAHNSADPEPVLQRFRQAATTPLVAAGSPRKCSACGAPLTVTSVWLQCTSCRGIFIGFDRLRELVEMLEVANVPTSFPRLETTPTLLPRLCPNCGFAMQQHEFFRQSVDVCLDHGIWFDVPELENAAAKMQQLLIQMRVHGVV